MARGRLRLHRASKEPRQGGATRQALGPCGEAENTYVSWGEKTIEQFRLLWKNGGWMALDFDVPNLATIILDL